MLNSVQTFTRAVQSCTVMWYLWQGMATKLRCSHSKKHACMHGGSNRTNDARGGSHFEAAQWMDVDAALWHGMALKVICNHQEACMGKHLQR